MRLIRGICDVGVPLAMPQSARPLPHLGRHLGLPHSQSVSDEPKFGTRFALPRHSQGAEPQQGTMLGLGIRPLEQLGHPRTPEPSGRCPGSRHPCTVLDTYSSRGSGPILIGFSWVGGGVRSAERTPKP
jgi:hypothetical protein